MKRLDAGAWAALHGLQAFVFGAAAVWLPWRLTVFSLLTGLFAGSSLLALVVRLLPRSRWGDRLSAAHAVMGLAVAVYCTGLFTSSALHLAQLYGRLGGGVGWAIMLLVAPCWLLTVPSGIARLRSDWAWLWGMGAASALLLVTFGWAGPTPATAPVSSRADLGPLLGRGSSSQRLFVLPHPYPCRGEGPIRVLVAGRRRRMQLICARGDTVEQAMQGALKRVRVKGLGPPLKVDILHGASSLSEAPLLARPFVLRPGLDAVCRGELCLAPWQLIMEGAYAAFEPVDFIPDLRIGVDLEALSSRLPSEEPLMRLSADSYLIDAAGKPQELQGMVLQGAPPPEPAVVTGRAEAFILAHERPGGGFHYLIDPHRGALRTKRSSIPRQAGTAYALCEWGGEGVSDAVARALDRLERQVVPLGDIAVAGRRGRLGPSALTAVALLSCRSRFGARSEAVDRALRGLVRGILVALDEQTGRFATALDAEGRPLPGPHVLYADGQAVLALVLALDHVEALDLDRGRLRKGLERAMDYAAGPYWPPPLRSFFFLEENWTCLAARAALTRFRNDGYERLCLDYIEWKKRLILERAEFASWEGAHHFGHVSPPFVTPTAGFAEAASAALELKRARGGQDLELEELLKKVQLFLRRAQWGPEACFACRGPEIVGAFSAHLGAAGIRIDFVQHALAGVAGIERALGAGPAARQGD